MNGSASSVDTGTGSSSSASADNHDHGHNQHEFLDVPSREGSASPVLNGDSHFDSQGGRGGGGPGGGSSGGAGGSNSRITTGKSGRVIERLMSEVDRFLYSPCFFFFGFSWGWVLTFRGGIG
jgi:hypothetical protein